jgi:SAM-dependent methyltransferase
MHSHIDFGYPAAVIYGHLFVTAVVLPLALLAWFRKWSKWVFVPAAAIALWSLTAFALVRFGFDMNGRMTLPTQSFLTSGTGRVLDMGAGTGRSSIMILEARPNCTLVALDLFGESYDSHFGANGKTQDVTQIGRQRLWANFRAAGVDQRASIQPGDMRHMPFEPASFDAIVSAYAIDHLNAKGAQESLAEAARVLKPKGEFLLVVIAKDAWINYVWGPLLLHAGMRGPARWTELLNAAGFDVAERGTQPATLYFLARKR